jgi:hypothetical protein
MTYQEMLGNLQQGFADQDFTNYAQNQGVPVTYNQELNRLLVGNSPVDISKLGMKNQEGKLYGSETTYQQLLEPYLNKGPTDIMSLKPYETPEWIKQYMKDMVAQQMSSWEYNMEEDPNVIMARQQLENSMAEMTGKRGFMYGSAQQQLVNQAFNKISPMFEEVAYQQQEDRYQRQMQLANTIMQWDDMMANRKVAENQLIQMKSNFMLALSQRDLEVFKVMLSQRRFNMELELEEQRFDLDKKKQEMDLAWKKVNEFGYADNETAAILGVDPGTEAGWVKKLVLQHKQELETMKKKNEYDVKMLQVNKKLEMDLIKEQEKIKTESQIRLMEVEYGFKEAIMEVEEVYRRKLEAKKEAERKAAEEKARREAEAQARAKAEKEAKEEQFDVQYKGALARLKEKYVRNGYIPDKYQNDASKFLYDSLKAGTISNVVYNRLIAEYWLTEYTPVAKYKQPYSNLQGVSEFQQWALNLSRSY